MNNSTVTVTYTDKWQHVADDRSSHIPTNTVVLPEALKLIPKSDELPKIRHRWNINEEIASWLTSFHKHGEWLSTTLKLRPSTGSILLYNRKKVKFRHDGFAWKKRREGRAIREDHMKLKVRGEECISGGYVHSAIVPTFHRRSYWLLQNPDIVLVHYLNDWQPHESMGSSEDSLVFNPALASKSWEAKELLEQIQPMFIGLKLSVNGATESTTGSASLEALVQYMLAEQAKSGHLIEQETTKNSKNESKSGRNSCACHKGKGKKRNSSPRSSVRHGHEASPSASEPTVTIEPQRQPPSQTKVVPSDILAGSGANGAHSSESGAFPQSQRVLQNNVPAPSPVTGGGFHDNVPRTPPAPQMSDSSSSAALAMTVGSPIDYIPPRVTSEECEQLKRMVETDPNLKTARNRFRNNAVLPENTVRLPAGVLDIMQLNALTGQPPGQGGSNSVSMSNTQTIDCEVASSSAIAPSPSISSSYSGDGNTNSVVSQMDTSEMGSPFGAGQTCSDHEMTLMVQQARLSSSPGMSQASVGTPSSSQFMSGSTLGTTVVNQHRNSALSGTSGHSVHPSNVMHRSVRTPVNNQLMTHALTETSSSHPHNAAPSLVNPHHHHSPHPQHAPMNSNTPGTNQNSSNQVQSFINNIQSINQSMVGTNNRTSASGDAGAPLGSVLGPSEMDLDPFEFLKNTLNLYELDPETLSHSGIHDTHNQGSHVMMDVQQSSNSHQVFDGAGQSKVNKGSGSGSVDSSGRTDSASSTGSLVAIADFSPEWSYPEGGIKVLVAGPWNTSGEYSCVFDNFAVPASMIQPGLLRCFCPAHEKALVPLQVTCNGSVVSKSVLFEYKARRAAKTQQASSKQSQQEWIELDDKQFQMALLERLEKIEEKLGHISPQATQQDSSKLCNSHLSFEERVIQICEKLMLIVPSKSGPNKRDPIPRGMTLLHLAAALGYANLIKTLRKWRDLRECLFMELEMDPLNIDDHSCTPIMWACALGHQDAALRLYQWNPRCLRMSDRLHRLPISTARSRGHTSLADCLQKMDDGQNVGHITQPVQSKAGGHFPGPTGSQITNGPSKPSLPIEIPTSLAQLQSPGLPSFMISSPVSETPDSSVGTDLESLMGGGVGDNISVSSGVLSQLSASPRGTSSTQPSPHMSPLGASDTSENSSIPPSLYEDLQTLFEMGGEGEMDSGGFDESYMFKVPSQPPHHPNQPLHGTSKLPPPSSRQGDRRQPSTSGMRYHQGERNGISDITEEAWDGLDRKRAENIALSLERLKSIFAQDYGDDMMDDTPKPPSKEQYLSLAEQILDALPARIKEGGSGNMNVEDIDIGPPPFSPLSVDIEDEMGEPNDYRSGSVDSPASTHSTTDSSYMPSPPNAGSLSREDDGKLNWFDFFPDPFIDGTTLGGFSLLTLSDEEQRQLYKAALVIQNAFRQYKGRQRQKQQELEAAVIIQSYYRRYRDYVGYYQMGEAARVIQNRFRGYKHYRQFQRSRRAAIIIQSRFRSYRANKQFRRSRDAAILIQQRFRGRRTARLKREQDAARKIQRFIRHYQNRLKR